MKEQEEEEEVWVVSSRTGEPISLRRGLCASGHSLTWSTPEGTTAKCVCGTLEPLLRELS